jgi:hypothetical protein
MEEISLNSYLNHYHRQFKEKAIQNKMKNNLKVLALLIIFAKKSKLK